MNNFFQIKTYVEASKISLYIKYLNASNEVEASKKAIREVLKELSQKHIRVKSIVVTNIRQLGGDT